MYEYQVLQRVDPEVLEGTLNAYGDEGWRVAHIHRVPGRSYYWVLLERADQR